MAIDLTRREKQALERSGSLVLPLPSTQAQPKATYWNKYGERFDNLPCDPWSLQSYMRRGLHLQPPEHPEEKPPELQIGVADWDGKKQQTPGEVPLATYYTAQGTAVSLPADPESLAQYLASGLSLDPPKGSDDAS